METGMNFEDAYKQLEKEFKKRVAEDCKQWKFKSVFLPNEAPKAPVDYVLVAMEPSLKGWAKDIPDARKKICKGFRNFCGVWLLHFAISEYLCRDGETYYLTDLAKGAMETNSPGAGDMKKYEAWYPLLQEELGLVAKTDAKIISIGSRVGRFLSSKALYRHAGTIGHYSGSGSGYFGVEIHGREKAYNEFAAKLDTIPGYSHKPCHSCATDHISKTIPVSESRKKLLFDYKTRFERIREEETSGWRHWQKEWQSRIT
jgi:hypothetical protein